MADLFDLFSTPAEQPTGNLARVKHFAEQARQGRLAALEALNQAVAEVDAYLARQAQARDTEVRATTEGKTTANPRATSARAARNIAPKTGTQRARVLAAVVRHGGLTDLELAEQLGLLENSVRPRRTELVTGGYVVDSGRTRTHRGTEWVVWEATDAGKAWFADQLGGAA
ncbi:helix-turn-helix domain-containing protein [Saccharomonospora cyanea]|uniref:Uncharacterized protein n=1 Tax=Saccharomonospora cyanea NA-134 TaxID=882082 RepID=H5XG68_9PSEU|nr:helix-turn-helix domain-containing protein [Saccharomonospora cyanea]EHR62650.1 hypothetical protein SaccyDRAFT_3823 [Saccharomonospora cyanea NA-134]